MCLSASLPECEQKETKLTELNFTFAPPFTLFPSVQIF